MQHVSVAIIEKNGRILIAQREKDDPLRDLWEFPGGKIEPGETPEGCVRREVYEELGLLVDKMDFLCSTRYDYAHTTVELSAFRVECKSGTPVTDFYRTIKWVKPEALNDYDFPGANAVIIQKLAADAKTRK